MSAAKAVKAASAAGIQLGVNGDDILLEAQRIIVTLSLDKEGRPRRSSKGPLFDANYEGLVIVVGSTEPCLAAARVLKARGRTGRLEMWDTFLPYCRFHTDIDRAAGMTIEEGDGQARPRKYRFYLGGDAQDGDFASGGTPVAQTGESRSCKDPPRFDGYPGGTTKVPRENPA